MEGVKMPEKLTILVCVVKSVVSAFLWNGCLHRSFQKNVYETKIKETCLKGRGKRRLEYFDAETWCFYALNKKSLKTALCIGFLFYQSKSHLIYGDVQLFSNWIFIVFLFRSKLPRREQGRNIWNLRERYFEWGGKRKSISPISRVGVFPRFLCFGKEVVGPGLGDISKCEKTVFVTCP